MGSSVGEGRHGKLYSSLAGCRHRVGEGGQPGSPLDPHVLTEVQRLSGQLSRVQASIHQFIHESIDRSVDLSTDR